VDVPLRAALFVDNGYVVERFDYDRDEGYYLQVLEKNGKVFRILVADEQLFRTNFNQQYLLGYYDRRYFEEVYNDFPVARVLKVKKNDPRAITE
jgi:dolichyl-diphosphooligosaccharide--protein glycosyltransferase